MESETKYYLIQRQQLLKQRIIIADMIFQLVNHRFSEPPLSADTSMLGCKVNFTQNLTLLNNPEVSGPAG